MKTVASELLKIAKSLVAARPIPIDKKAVKEFVDDILLSSVFRWASQQNPNKKLGRQPICKSVFSLKNPRGEHVSLDVIVQTSPHSNDSIFTGGYFSRVKSPGRWKIVLGINENLYPSSILENPNKLGAILYSAMIHELTHALDVIPDGVSRMDYLKKQNSPGVIPTGDDIDFKKYVNNPVEVRAHMQQVVDEVLTRVSNPYYLAFLKRTYPNDMKDKMIGKNAMTNLSPKWCFLIENGISKENRKKILQAVYRALEDSGLFDRTKEVNDGAVLE
jgi:hypothetical protein